ncbi:hypothetical protein BGW36DRAFT_421868 [Talaromyces proteolyticus]|uniref:Uncharacterized protein n=1 Tax=Talaromyces proteolyticus TaxID=1131652 RepID=A0AAD4L2A2_9EURO|nr:uncharacterized protein BGW36DRAFT_421868 [Talaromyces proteolyticus]KAH8705306.1 hypothetical protein BGW36DRAFT_421868 [Talaromyces proteolyticus]
MIIFAVTQALWLVVNCILRTVQGLAITTLELTSVSFVVVFFVTSFCWYHKPSDISTATTLRTNTHIDDIRAENCPNPSKEWHESPLDFLREDRFFCDLHWRYYNQILQRIHLPIFSRPVSKPLWDRIPSDTFPQVDLLAECIAGPVILLFASIFMFGWNFDFATPVDQIIWRVCSVYMVCYAVFGELLALYSQRIALPRLSLSRKQQDEKETPQAAPLPIHVNSLERLAERLRNIDPDKDPINTIPLRVLIPSTILCALYFFARALILTEDLIGLRCLPSSAFQTVNWINSVPHW